LAGRKQKSPDLRVRAFLLCITVVKADQKAADARRLKREGWGAAGATSQPRAQGNEADAAFSSAWTLAVVAGSDTRNQMIRLGEIETKGNQAVNAEHHPAAFGEGRTKNVPINEKDQVEKQNENEKGQQHRFLPYLKWMIKFLRIL